jgi:hypothetical protein
MLYNDYVVPAPIDNKCRVFSSNLSDFELKSQHLLWRYLFEMFFTSPTFLGLFEYADFGEILFENDVCLNPFCSVGPR